ncbi:DUF799 domain-containing protein [Paracandidimonas soli]|uniref:Lipoprotein n=1 Tax=Paracandidimonas soli TaxID=1917182 RepID=A0A4R3VCL6_9BURK|nr:DUF799 domain-containing protein [Paracandidimonas soli]TCV03066.1 hypothetical protein EV686_101528 [Paracandidimonas soli]
MQRILSYIGSLTLLVWLTGCVTTDANLDYTAFRESKPASILVLPPLNSSIEVEATTAVLAQSTLPLAESGYYVVPVALMDETFRQNGLTEPEDIHQLPLNKLREIFGADSALYITVTEYGSQYAVLASTITVAADASLIDLRTGTTLWSGQKKVAQSSGGGSLLGMLVQAVVDQVVNTLSDRSYQVAGVTTQMLLGAGQPGGILYGPRSPHYETQ